MDCKLKDELAAAINPSPAETECVCKEAVLKLEAICGGDKQQAMEELVSDREGGSTPAADTLNKADLWSERVSSSPDSHGKVLQDLRTSSPLQQVLAYQIPLVDRSINQSLSYPPPPPPSPGFALEATPAGSPAIHGEVESCFVTSPCPPAVENTSSGKQCGSDENLLDTESLAVLPIKSDSLAKPVIPDQPTEPTSSDPVPSGEASDASCPPTAVFPPQPEVASQPLSQYPPQIPATQFQQPVAAAPAQPIVITQQTTDSNTQQQSANPMMGGVGHGYFGAGWPGMYGGGRSKNARFLVLSVILLILSFCNPVVLLCAIPALICAIVSLGEAESDHVYGMMMERENRYVNTLNMLSMICSILGFTSCFFLTAGVILFMLFLFGIGHL